MNRSVYLSGPISSLNWHEATGWRDDVKVKLGAHGIRALSPMRQKEFLKGVSSFSATCETEGVHHPLSTPRGIMTRDFHDSTVCDVMLVNLLGASRVSIGTMMELAWAFQKRTPVVCAIEDDRSNVHEHGMVSEALGYRVPTLGQAVDIVLSILVG